MMTQKLMVSDLWDEQASVCSATKLSDEYMLLLVNASPQTSQS